ncbi:PfkB family carbohydrate kinase [Nocardia inohanensis]|uniref:PfkB family carbohydrate kinase n=1 Tax=Nocardia inohanensis TaxID=209246 RepID=UPI000A693996|nr:PfkB family carbohydrate kinase [Nocardia inohanensis]
MVAVRSILIGLRKRSGLSPARLRSTEIDTAALLQLSVTKRYAHLHGITPAEALPDLMTHVARQLPPTPRLIVDAELCLEMLRDEPPEGIDLELLYGANLDNRRRYLAQHWRRLHAALGVAETGAGPTARALRDAPETEAFTALARLLVSGAVPIASRRNTVTVVGDAAMDQINIVDEIPSPGTSVWGDFRRHPGGKGLNRAVALARLGIDARMIAAVGADRDGDEILKYLREQDIDTSLIKEVVGARTPVATVILPRSGESATIAFKQDRIRLTVRDLETGAILQALQSSAAVLITLEQPGEIVAQVLATAGATPDPPWVILNVSPPAPLPRSIYEHLSAVDYVIGTSGEVAGLWPDCAATDSAQRLLQLGVGAVCMIEGSHCTVRSRAGQLSVSRFDTAMAGSAGASSAFSAALTYRLIAVSRPAEGDDFEWATAAMAARQTAANIPESMPSTSEIERTVTS